MENLKDILAIQSYSGQQFRMFAYIIRALNSLNIKYDVINGNIYATKGDADFYPCVVSHMDTVHKIVSDLTVLEINGNLTGFNKNTMLPTGIGGDDKVGIFITLECLKTFDNIKAVFFRDEETGCNGSYDCEEDFFIDCGFVLQCDRQKYGDFVTNACGVKLSDSDFQSSISSILKKYKYKFTDGGMTDVMALKEIGVNCAMANISCGYYNPHSENEYVNIKEVALVLSMVKQIIIELEGLSFTCVYTQPIYNKVQYKAPYKSDYVFNKQTNDWDIVEYENETMVCDGCGIEQTLEYIDDFDCHLCSRCLDDYLDYIPNNKKHFLDCD